ncbi:GntR family transcriptional regulator [Paramicrobacterium chengjingii]|uniref:GntR family transcriptional regulator n=1 Tax=Paramicrobacterium chengjingii TaxID=2769067 RepID=UPI00141E1C75|nr:GntR family transcriptional regulator [Microbacterium chengjingii]
MLEPIAHDIPSLSDTVFDRIREAILTRNLLPGSRVVESTIAKQFSVSKTPVREAFLKLAQIGLIEQDGRESRVVSASRKAIEDSFQVRRVLEDEALKSLGNLSGVGLNSLLDLSQLSDESNLNEDSISRFHDARLFHLNLAKMTENTFLYNSITNLYDLTWILRHRDSRHSEQSVENAVQHKQIAHLLATGDIDSARVLMRDHLNQVLQAALDEMIDEDSEDASRDLF